MALRPPGPSPTALVADAWPAAGRAVAYGLAGERRRAAAMREDLHP